ncbi:MAG: FlgO family outer membrane protein [Spirochaetota bacterium]
MKKLYASVLVLLFLLVTACSKTPENVAEMVSPIIYSMSKNLIAQKKHSGEMNITVVYSNLHIARSGEWPTGEIKCNVEFSEYKGKIAKIQYILDGSHLATAIVEMPFKNKEQVKVNLYENAIVFGQAQSVENKISELSEMLVKKTNLSDKIAIFDFVGLNEEKTLFGKRISESLMTNLSQKDLKIVERKLLTQVITEKTFQMNGLTGDDIRNEIGKFLGADSILVGTIKVEKEEIIVNSRIINIKNGTVTSSARIIFPKYLIRLSDLDSI